MDKIINANKIYLKAQFFILIMLIASSCLPVQKKTQCGDNEAFNGSQRKCVPVVGAASTGTVFITSRVPDNSFTTNRSGNPVTHQVAISDVYKYGHTVKWTVSFSGVWSSGPNAGLTATGSMNLSSGVAQYTFVPVTMYNFFGTGSYVLEATVYDSTGTNQLDSTSWNIAIVNYQTPSFGSSTPAGTIASYSSNLTSVTHSINISNPDGLSGKFKYYLNGTLTQSTTFTSPSVIPSSRTTPAFDPSALGKGIHLIELELTDASDNVYDSHLWTVNVIDPDLPQVVSILSSNVGAGSTYDIVASGVVYAIDGVAWNAAPPNAGFRNNDLTAGYPAYNMDDICVTVDNFDKNGIAGTDVRLRVSIDGNVVDTEDFTTNVYCINSFTTPGLPTQTLALPQSTLSKTLTFSTINALDSTVIQSFPINLIVRPANIAPTISINYSSTDPSLTCTTSNGYISTGCTQTQSLDADNDTNFTSVLPDADNSKTYAIKITDPDELISGGGFDVVYQLRKDTGAFINLDGVTNYTTTAQVDCTQTINDLFSYECNLHFSTYNQSGSIPPGNYILQAFVIDTTDPLAAGLQTSNVVSWNIAVTEYQSKDFGGGEDHRPVITGISTVNYGASSSCTLPNGLPNDSEGDYLQISVDLDEYDRDGIGTLILQLENQYIGLGFYSSLATIPNPTITRTVNIPNDGLSTSGTITACVQIPEWAVVGVENRDVSIKAIVIDSPDVLTGETSDPFIGTITNLFNNNHTNTAFIPDITDPTTVDLSAHTAVSGYEYHITAPPFTDSSTYGGNNKTWKWQISAAGAGTWTDIPQANSTDKPSNQDLYWTPDPGSTWADSDVDFRFCVGDDGYGNDVNTCTEFKLYENLNIQKNNKDLAIAVDSNTDTVASWYDSTEKYLYVAHASDTNVVVEKIDYSDPIAITENRTKHSIRFPAINPYAGLTAREPTNIRLAGIDGEFLYVIYSVFNETVTYNELRVNRIDLSLVGPSLAEYEAFGFNYSGVYGAVAQGDEFFTTVTGGTATVGNIGATSNLLITFNGLDGDFLFLDNVTGPQNFNFASYCFVGPCTTTAQTAANFASTINATSTFFGGTVVAEASGSTVAILGNEINSQVVANTAHITSMGKPMISGTNLYIPFLDGLNNNRVSYFALASITTGGDFSVVSTAGVSAVTGSPTNNSEIDSANGVAVATDNFLIVKNSNGNLDAYKVSLSNGGLPNVILTTSVTNLVPSSITSTFTGMYQLSASVDPNDNLLISAVTEYGSPTNYNLLAGAIYNNLATSQFKVSTFSNFVDIFDQAKITASRTTAGEAFIAFTTADAANVLYESRVIKVKATISAGSFTGISFPNEGSWTPPPLNSGVATLSGGSIHVTPVYAVELGMADGTPGATPSLPNSDAYKSHNSFFFTYHEDNGGDGSGSGNPRIRATVINTDLSSSPTTETSTEFAFPPFVKNQ